MTKLKEHRHCVYCGKVNRTREKLCEACLEAYEALPGVEDIIVEDWPA